MIITQDQVREMILDAVPSFRPIWDRSEDQELPYVVMGDLARHLLSQYLSGCTEEFEPLCEVVERLHVSGDSYVREFATIGILEAIQNVWSHTDTDPEEFAQFLRPVSKKWWKELNDFWAGRIPYVGAGLVDRAV